MKPLTFPQAFAVADALDVTPEIIATNGVKGEIHLLIPNFSKDDAQAFIEVVTGGLHIPADALIITDDVVEGSNMPCASVIIHTEN
jgi:hypothetical protein